MRVEPGRRTHLGELLRRGVALGVVAILPLLAAVPSAAFILYEGESLRVNLDTTLTYGLLWRVQDRDKDLIGSGNGGDAPNVNWDDGNLNYDKGIVSNLGKITSELDLRTDRFGAFVRGLAFYDTENTDGDRERYHLSDDAKDQVGRNAKLLDAYAWASFDLGPMPAQVRAGEQVVNWGESTFIAGGIGLNTLNAIDLAQLRSPGAELREALVPEGMLWASLGLLEGLSVEGVYVYDWEETHLDEPGSYWSVGDLLGDGGRKALIADIPDMGNAPASQTFLAVPRDADVKPDDGKDGDTQGQFGVALRYYAPWLNATELSFYYLRYHSKLPTLSVRTGTQQATEVDAPAAAAAVYSGAGVNPGEDPAVDAAAQAAALDVYAHSMRYRAEYEEDIDLIGLGFNTEILGWGVQGEVSHRFDVPLQIDDTELLFAGVSPTDPTGFIGANNQVGDFRGQYELWLDESVKRDMTQVQVTFSKLFGALLGAEGSAFLAEVGWLHVHNMPDKRDVRLETYGPFGTGNSVLGPLFGSPVEDEDDFPDADSWGYVLYGQLDYKNAIGPVALSPHLAWSHDVHGISPNGGPFVEGRKALTAGVEALYLQDWSADLSYTSYFGAGKLNLHNDRDYIGFSLKYRF